MRRYRYRSIRARHILNREAITRRVSSAQRRADNFASGKVIVGHGKNGTCKRRRKRKEEKKEGTIVTR